MPLVPVVVMLPPLKPVPAVMLVTVPPVAEGRLAHTVDPATVVNTCPAVAEGAILALVTAPSLILAVVTASLFIDNPALKLPAISDADGLSLSRTTEPARRLAFRDAVVLALFRIPNNVFPAPVFNPGSGKAPERIPPAAPVAETVTLLPPVIDNCPVVALKLKV